MNILDLLNELHTYVSVRNLKDLSLIHIYAGHANMFLSSIFRDTLAGVTGATIELYDTDGSVGAAKGAGIGAGIYKDNNEAFATLDKLDVIEPNVAKRQEYADAYAKWKYRLEKSMTGNIPAPVLSSDK